MLLSWDGMETLSGSYQWVLALLDLSLKTTVLLLCGFLLGRTLRSQAARIRQVLWVSIIIGALALPLLAVVLPQWHVASIPSLDRQHPPQWINGPIGQPIVDRTEVAQGPAPFIEDYPVSATQATATPMRGRRLLGSLAKVPWTVWVLGVWLAGALLVIAAFLVGLARTRRLAARSLSLERGSWLRLLAECSERVGLSRAVRLRIADVSAPATWGWLRPVVVMPHDADTWPDECKRVVLLHELTHVKRRDWLAHRAVRLLCAVYWFNPLVWIATKHLCIEREMACDDNVICLGAKPSEYATHLLQIARSMTFRTPALSAALTMARPSQLEGRLLSILQSTNRHGGRKIWLVPIFVVLLALPIASMRSGQSPRAAVPSIVRDADFSPLLSREVHEPEPATFADAEESPPIAAASPSPQTNPSPIAAEQPDRPTPTPTPEPKPSPRNFRGTWVHSEDSNGGRTFYQIGYLDGEFVFEERMGDLGLHMRIEGNVEFNDEGDAIKRMGDGAFVLLEATQGRRDVRLEITANRMGGFENDWMVNGKKAPFDDDARQWTQTAISILSRRIQIGFLSGERNSLQGEINSIYGERNSLEGEINSIRGERNALQGEINTIYGERNARQGEINAMLGEQRASAGDIRGLAGDINALRGEINAIRGERNALMGTLNALQAERKTLQRERRQIETQATSREKSERDYQGRIARLDGDIRDVDERIADTEGQIESLRVDDRVREIEDRIGTLEMDERSMRAQQETTAKEMQEQARRMATEMNVEVEQRVQEVQERLAELKVEEMVQSLKDRIADLKLDQRVEDLRDQIEALQFDTRMESLEKTLAPLYKDLEKDTKRILR